LPAVSKSDASTPSDFTTRQLALPVYSACMSRCAVERMPLSADDPDLARERAVGDVDAAAGRRLLHHARPDAGLGNRDGHDRRLHGRTGCRDRGCAGATGGRRAQRRSRTRSMVSATDIDAHVDAGQDDRDTGGNGERQTYPGPEKHSTRECNVPSPADAPGCRCGDCDGCAVRSGNGSNLKAAQFAEQCDCSLRSRRPRQKGEGATCLAARGSCPA
jgi:hypothetical protein